MRRISTIALLIAATFGSAAVAAPAYDPQTAASPPSLTPLPASVERPALGADDWKRSNETVGAMPRGHMDVLRWEARNPAKPDTPAATGPVLTPGEAVRIAMQARPELVITTETSEIDRIDADSAVLALAHEVHRDWIEAVAARTALTHAEQAFAAVDTATELATRMTRNGTWSQERLLRARLDRAAALETLVAARSNALAARARLVRELGLWGEDAERFTLPAELPALPAEPLAFEGLERSALTSHPRLAILAREAGWEMAAIPQATLARWRGAVAAQLPADTAEPGLASLPARAPMLDLRRLVIGHEIPAAARAEARAERLAATIRANVREAWQHYRSAFEMARAQRNEVVQLADALQDETLLRYNGMLASTWDVLDGAVAQTMARANAHDALRRFWLAHTDLQAVLAGGDYAGPEAGAGGMNAAANAGGH